MCIIMSAPYSCLLIPAFLSPQDLKPSNLAVNEDCELKVRQRTTQTNLTLKEISDHGSDIDCLTRLSRCSLLFHSNDTKSLRSWTLVWHGTPMTK